jgi:hypothetical protein
MSYIALMSKRDTEAAKPRDESGRGMSPREVLARRISARRGAH